MRPLSRLLLVLASLLLLTTFFTPIWKISIEAPQYPEGMGLEIWINKVTGENPNDLMTLNGLNHYIGMKTIEQDDIPELQYMPYIIVFFAIFALVLALNFNRNLVVAWLVLLMLTGLLGMYDFYKWEYDYGHNLNPNAPIKVPGMNYQPPLIGSKQLLNINATSLPWLGTGALVLSAMLVGYVLLTEEKKRKKRHDATTRAILGVFLVMTAAFEGCGKQPVPIEYGIDTCGECKMLITDSRFGAEAITEKGKILYFDSIECMVDFTYSLPHEEANHTKYFVTNYYRPSFLVPVEESYFMIDEGIQSPMGGNIAAYSDSSAARKNSSTGREALTWLTMLAEVKNK